MHRPCIKYCREYVRLALPFRRPCLTQVKGGGRALVGTKDVVQLLNYAAGQQFEEHYDNRLGSTEFDRAVTVLVYLSASGGGETCFRQSTGVGPRGRGNMFPPINRCGAPSQGCLEGACVPSLFFILRGRMASVDSDGAYDELHHNMHNDLHNLHR